MLAVRKFVRRAPPELPIPAVPALWKAAAAAGLCAALNAVSLRLQPAPWPLRQALGPDSALETAALVSVGMRRLAADLELVRLLIYYGTAEAGPEREEAHTLRFFDPKHPELAWGGGVYAELGPRILRILDMDPSFDYVALYGAGALAFNLNRPDDAKRVLQYALSRDPHNSRYQATLAAVGLHRRGDAAGVVRILEPILDTPDCPVMIRHLVAYLYVKTGRRQEARVLYRRIIATTQDAGYRGLAAAALARLGPE